MWVLKRFTYLDIELKVINAFLTLERHVVCLQVKPILQLDSVLPSLPALFVNLAMLELYFLLGIMITETASKILCI